ncbi:hypothetical protein GPECTOR_12g560 [Gonium pectorale]|uniref:BAG domain-containing protein n=1 Tax=Gonium pectorale TaxID=33097 RepID=A0A150GP10_GONPE|nr:hypothetical protein GPECTOR_12g560 [Gonium pectorale]|eukprot:KXZ51596.1 hypothetical protein GPECTOR_12g560 [Gonium pectorale]
MLVTPHDLYSNPQPRAARPPVVPAPHTGATYPIPPSYGPARPRVVVRSSNPPPPSPATASRHVTYDDEDEDSHPNLPEAASYPLWLQQLYGDLLPGADGPFARKRAKASAATKASTKAAGGGGARPSSRQHSDSDASDGKLHADPHQPVQPLKAEQHKQSSRQQQQQGDQEQQHIWLFDPRSGLCFRAAVAAPSADADCGAGTSAEAAGRGPTPDSASASKAQSQAQPPSSPPRSATPPRRSAPAVASGTPAAASSSPAAATRIPVRAVGDAAASGASPVSGATMTRSKAARTVQRWFRGWRLARHRPALRALAAASSQLRDAFARFYAYMGATGADITDRQQLEINELAMRIILRLDSMEGMPPEFRALRKHLTARALRLQDEVAAAYDKSAKRLGGGGGCSQAAAVAPASVPAAGDAAAESAAAIDAGTLAQGQAAAAAAAVEAEAHSGAGCTTAASGPDGAGAVPASSEGAAVLTDELPERPSPPASSTRESGAAAMPEDEASSSGRVAEDAVAAADITLGEAAGASW